MRQLQLYQQKLVDKPTAVNSVARKIRDRKNNTLETSLENAKANRLWQYEDLHTLKINVQCGDIQLEEKVQWDVFDPRSDPESYASALCEDMNLPMAIQRQIAYQIRMQCFEILTRHSTNSSSVATAASQGKTGKNKGKDKDKSATTNDINDGAKLVKGGNKRQKIVPKIYGVRRSKKDVEEWTPIVTRKKKNVNV